jgi:hypothetical protein
MNHRTGMRGPLLLCALVVAGAIGSPNAIASTITCGISTVYEVGAPYSATCVASGGTAPYTWSIDAGSLAPGLTLNPTTGPTTTISGVLTTAGDFPFTLLLTDADGPLSSFSFSYFDVTPGPSFSCGSFRAPEVGVPFSLTCTAINPQTYYQDSRWSISAGALPAGLLLNIEGNPTGIFGTPTIPGPFSFTLEYTDFFNAKAPPQTFTGNIVIAPVSSCTNAVGPFVVGVPYMTTCSVTGGYAALHLGSNRRNTAQWNHSERDDGQQHHCFGFANDDRIFQLFDSGDGQSVVTEHTTVVQWIYCRAAHAELHPIWDG